MIHFKSIEDHADPHQLLTLAKSCKARPYAYEHIGQRKSIGLLFFNPSLRTRLSTQRAAQHLGLTVMSMDVGQHGWKLEFGDGQIMNGQTAEHIREAAAVLSQYCEIIGIRCFPGLTNRDYDYQETVLNAFCRYASVPVFNMESATRHPLQGLADWLTISEYTTLTKPKVVLSWAPHPKALPQSVANSFVKWMQAAEVDLYITHPPAYELAPEIVGGTPVVYDQTAALAEADFVYCKNWSSYTDYGKVLSPSPDWMMTPDKLGQAHFMHCLPVRRNVVVADAVLDGPRSLVIRQAENRTYAAQAVLLSLLKQEL